MNMKLFEATKKKLTLTDIQNVDTAATFAMQHSSKRDYFHITENSRHAQGFGSWALCIVFTPRAGFCWEREMDGWMDGGMDGGMDGWRNGWMDGWMDDVKC